MIKSKEAKFFTASMVRRSVMILAPSDRKKVLLVILIYLFLGVLDIAAVFVLGLVGSLSVSGISSNRPGDRVLSFLDFLGVSDSSLQNQVATLGLLASGVLLLKSIASLYLTRRTLFFLSRRSAVISRTLIIRLLGQEIVKVRSRSIQETIFALTGGVQAVNVAILGSALLLIADTFLILAFSLSLFLVDTLVAFSSLFLFSTVGVMLYWYLHKRAEYLGERATILGIKSNEKISEIISCYRELLVKNRRDFYAQEIGDTRLEIAEASASLGVMAVLSKYIMEITMVVGGLAIAASQFITQPASRAVAVISIFLVSSARMAPAILRIQTGLITIRTNIGLAKPTLDLIEEHLESTLTAELDVTPYRGMEFFEHVGFEPTIQANFVEFAYPGQKEPVLRNINLEILSGEFLGIVGPSGSGKTTLVDLLLGVSAPTKGQIKISGESTSSVKEVWPGAIAYVPQETSIINGSIKENVCLGYRASEVPDLDVENILKTVELEELINLPSSIHSSAGERGGNLSGGQRQRIGLARALFTKPKLLVLDEATSALDATTERKLTDYLTSLKGNLTMIVVAHRLSTVKNADRIIYIKNGEIMGQGTFQELRLLLPEFDDQAKAMGL